MGEIVEILAAVEGQAETHLFIKSLSLAAPVRDVGNKAVGGTGILTECFVPP